MLTNFNTHQTNFKPKCNSPNINETLQFLLYVNVRDFESGHQLQKELRLLLVLELGNQFENEFVKLAPYLSACGFHHPLLASSL
jgi:hypothetical protein